MKYFFMFLGVCGICFLIAVAIAMFVGVPSNPKEVVKIIDISQ